MSLINHWFINFSISILVGFFFLNFIGKYFLMLSITAFLFVFNIFKFTAGHFYNLNESWG